MCGKMFKRNFHGFRWREKIINIHIVYEHTYFSTFIIIPSLLILTTTGHI